jgi:excisionase family DNA binding protein
MTEKVGDHALKPRLAVSVAEAGRLIGVGRTRLYAEIASGGIKTFKVGRRRLIRVQILEEWIASREAA